MTLRRSRSLSRWALWAFAAALLLKAAMPLLAGASARMQGKALVEVCTVYGVSLAPLDGDSHAPAPDHGSTHGGGHCALTALAALAAPELPSFDGVAAPAHEGALPRAHADPQARDACATWGARLKHGPPTVA